MISLTQSVRFAFVNALLILTVYGCNEDNGVEVTQQMLEDFEKNGYIIIRSLLNKDERTRLLGTLESDECFKKFAYGRDDGKGRKTQVVLWNLAGNDITGVVPRCHKVAETMEKLLGGEIYHYHSKLIKKDAHTGGMHVWHQDYGYWYNNGCLYPNMGTIFIAMDKAHKGNGCLQILEGSHKMGRIDHVRIGDQNGICEEKMDQIFQNIKPTHVELDPGDALFFHCNVIHKSEQNRSGDRRWAFLCAYNRADNNPVLAHHHPSYSKMIKVPNNAIVTSPTTVNWKEKDFFRIKDDISVEGLADEHKET